MNNHGNIIPASSIRSKDEAPTEKNKTTKNHKKIQGLMAFLMVVVVVVVLC